MDDGVCFRCKVGTEQLQKNFKGPTCTNTTTTNTFVGELRIDKNAAGVAALHKGEYGQYTKVTTHVHIWNNPGLTAVPLGSLEEIGGTLAIYSNPKLRGLPQLKNLRRVGGHFILRLNAAGFDYSGLEGLKCHGGFSHSSLYDCPGCPTWLINLPKCCPVTSTERTTAGLWPIVRAGCHTITIAVVPVDVGPFSPCGEYCYRTQLGPTRSSATPFIR